MLGDQPAALYGQGCTTEGLATLTLGTGAFLWLNVGSARPEPPPGVLATVAWEKRAAGPTYALEAYCPNAGNALRLFPDLGFPPVDTVEALDWSRPHPVVVLAPAGLGTPLSARLRSHHRAGSDQQDDGGGPWAAALAGVAHQIADALAALDHDHWCASCGSAGACPRTTRCSRQWPTSPGGGSRSRPIPSRPRAASPRWPRKRLGCSTATPGRPESPGGLTRAWKPADARGSGRGGTRRSRATEGPARERGSPEPIRQGQESRARLEREEVDVLVVEGGITGVGIALDAASRGLSVGLIEADDLAAGTSSRFEQAHSRRPAVSRDAGVPARARGAS